LRGTELRATTGSQIVRVIDGNHWGCPELPSSPPTPDMHSHTHALRDTLLMLVVQLVFRAILVLQRWNYLIQNFRFELSPRPKA
jgi:hypothetical protein